MIESFLSPLRIKVLLAASGILFTAAAVLLVTAVYFSGQLDTERAEHETTREKLAAAVAEGLRWKVVAEELAKTVAGLQGAAASCLARETQAAVDAAARDAIMADSKPQERTPEESKGVVDEITRQKAVHRLNRPL